MMTIPFSYFYLNLDYPHWLVGYIHWLLLLQLLFLHRRRNVSLSWWRNLFLN